MQKVAQMQKVAYTCPMTTPIELIEQFEMQDIPTLKRVVSVTRKHLDQKHARISFHLALDVLNEKMQPERFKKYTDAL